MACRNRTRSWTYLATAGLCVLCAGSCGPAQPNRLAVVHYNFVGQCDSMLNVTVNGQLGPDEPGAAYLFIRIFAIENNRPDAVDFDLTDSKMFINQGDSRPTFNFDAVVHSPSPWLVPELTTEQIPTAGFCTDGAGTPLLK